MAAHPQPRLTPEQYLEIERVSPERHEYHDGEMFSMAGGSARQSMIIVNLAREISAALKGRPCSVMVQDMRTAISPVGPFAYPDLVVVCGEQRHLDRRNDTLTNPLFIVEVLSPTTEAYDRGGKFAQYRKIETLREYVLVSQTEPHVEIFRRQPDGAWLFTDVEGLSAHSAFQSIDCIVPLAEIYDKVTFEETK